MTDEGMKFVIDPNVEPVLSDAEPTLEIHRIDDNTIELRPIKKESWYERMEALYKQHLEDSAKYINDLYDRWLKSHTRNIYK